jgi:Flp pilus assembly protein TadG
MVHLSRLGRRDDGAIAIVTALLISGVFIGLCSLVVDLGMARDTRRQAQNASDASALAAGNALYLTGTADIPAAISAARSYATKNYGVSAADWAACTDSSALVAYHDPNSACISFDSSTAPTTVRVTVPIRQVQTPFAGIWGVHSVPVGAHAQIQLIAGGLAQCGLCVIGSGTHDLQNGSITVNGASVAINGTLDANPQGNITVTGTGSNIDLQGTVPGKGTYSPAPLVNQAPIVDPLINLTMPNYSTLTAKTHSCTQGPGIYDSLESCTGGMLPGLYVLTGSTSLAGNSGIVANGVTLDFVCSTSGVPRACNVGESGGGLTFRGNAYLNITAPTSGPNQGLSIVADRNYNATFSFGGNGAQANSGTIYAASGTLAYNGNGASGSLNSLIDVGDFSFKGSPSAFVSSYTQSANVAIASSDMHLSQ